jgi:hypothetical protein
VTAVADDIEAGYNSIMLASPKFTPDASPKFTSP